VAAAGLDGYVLLTTSRLRPAAGALAEQADLVLEVPPGRVDEIAGGLLEPAEGRPLVAFGGGRVVDVAKALAGAGDGRCAAVPTTLSGAEMTPFHRLPAGIAHARLVRPVLVVADPELMTGQEAPARAASAMNAMAHALEALYTPLANPVCDAAALEATRRLSGDLEAREDLALGALLAGYASGGAGFAVHHALCQTIVRTAGSPHAQTNAVMLPHTVAFAADRAPEAVGRFAAALGDPGGDARAAVALVEPLSARCGRTRLSGLGVDEGHVPSVARAAVSHPAVHNTPDPPDEAQIAALVRGAL